MNRKQRIIVSVVGISIVLLTLLGLTYAYFLTRIQGNTNDKSISVTTADLKLTYSDGNGDITATNILPGETIDTKTFTVKNEGNAKVDNYAVYLEEVINELSRNTDMVYTLTCTSDKGSCSGVSETTFPKLAGILVTNSIDVGETQSYELKVDYKEMGVDQSEDMGKKISARVQIYNLTDIVDVTGTVTNAASGDYVEMHSNPKTSQISDNKYLIAAVEPGTHTIYVKDKNGTVKGSKEIIIKKGSTASVSGANITVTSDSQTVNANITKIDTTLTLDINKPKDYSPFSEGTLAYNILNNAKTNANGTIYSKEPLTVPAQGVAGSKYYTDKADESTTETSISISKTYQGYYWTYGTGYTVDENTGKFTLTGVATCKYNDGTCNTTLVGKYIAQTYTTGISSATDTKQRTTDLSNIYKVTTAPASSTSSITMKVKEISSKSYETGEATLSVAKDDYGDSYYYRGVVTDNYVNFAGMCWKVVRIEGDGSTKLILEDYNTTCNSSSYTGNWSDGNTYLFGWNNDYRIDFISGDVANVLKSFQTTKMQNYLDKLKVDEWCYDDVIVRKTQGIADHEEYYGANKRIYTDKSPSLVCTGTKLTKYSDETSMYVGTLTADEIIYAGGNAYTSNLYYYLINDYAVSNFLMHWTLSPNYYSSMNSSDSVFCLGSNGVLEEYDVTGNGTLEFSDVSVRPSITLISSVQISSGNGTKSNPYVIS